MPNTDEAIENSANKYLNLPRGKVYMDVFRKFYIIGTPQLIDNAKAQAMIKHAFMLSGKDVSVEHKSDAQYTGAECPRRRR